MTDAEQLHNDQLASTTTKTTRAAKVEQEHQPNAKSQGSDDWKEKAVEIANQLGLQKWARGEREITGRNICDAVATALEKDSKYHGTRGPRAATSVRNALIEKGWNFVPPSGTNGTNGTNGTK